MTKTADKDEQLELKKRARRRLVGAVVFVSVAAVVLPLVMDEEPPPLAGGIELHIPEQEKGYTPPPVTVAAPVPAPAGDSAAAAVQPAGAPVSEAAPATGNKPDVKPEAAAEVKAEAKAEAVTAKAPPAPPAKTAATSANPANPTTGGDAKRAQAILDGRTDKAAAKGGGQYIVLIGAFANPGNVQIIQKKLGEMGIRVYTEALDTPQGRKTRVRAGPFASHDAAEKAAVRMKKIGIGGVVAAKS